MHVIHDKIWKVIKGFAEYRFPCGTPYLHFAKYQTLFSFVCSNAENKCEHCKCNHKKCTDKQVKQSGKIAKAFGNSGNHALGFYDLQAIQL